MDIHIDDIGILDSAWENLRPCDQKILRLKHLEKWSWQNISEHLSELENKKISAETARKRGQRSLSRLKFLFFKFKAVTTSSQGEY